MLCKYRNAGRSYFIGSIAVRSNAVAACYHGLYPSVLHDGGRHIVTDKSNIHACLRKLERCQARALEQRTRFIGKYPEAVAALMSKIHRRSRRTVADRRQMPRVAVRQYPLTFFQNSQPVLAQPSAYVYILIAYGLSLFFKLSSNRTRSYFCHPGSA